MTVAEIRTAAQRGKKQKFMFFWGHRPARDGRLTAASFSQWWPASFVVDGLRYPTAEHYMMAEKARLFGDETMHQRIIKAPHPGAAKQFGRQVRGFNEQMWTRERLSIVIRGNEAKFRQNEELKAFLMSTKRRILVEASPVDRIWGIGLAATDPRAKHPAQWRGENLLGQALMVVRDRLDKDQQRF